MAKVRKRTWTNKAGEQTAWIADYRDQSRVRRQKTFDTKKEAAEWLAAESLRKYIPGLPSLLLTGSDLHNGILTVAEINKFPIPSDAGIYFLFLGRRLQYIGQSSKVFSRIAKHRNSDLIAFDNWRFLPVELCDLDAIEAAYIRAHRPPHNVGVRRGLREDHASSSPSSNGSITGITEQRQLG